MPLQEPSIQSFELPEDLIEQVAELSRKSGESSRFIVIAAVEHFFRIPDQQRQAVLKGVSRRRRG